MQLRPIMNRFFFFFNLFCRFFSHLIRQVHHTSLDFNPYCAVWNGRILGVSLPPPSQHTPFFLNGQDSKKKQKKKECLFQHVHLHTFIYSWSAACGSRLWASSREHLYTGLTQTRLSEVAQTTVLVLLPSALVDTTNLTKKMYFFPTYGILFHLII